jgi:hypothetical protein
MRGFLFGALLGLSALLPMAATAQDMTGYDKQTRNSVIRFAANNSQFVLYHEVGHLLIDQLELPVLGREEDAADNMATWMLLRDQTPESEVALADAARGWELTGLAYGSGRHVEDLAASHSLDQQRAYQIVCMMVGSNKHTFRPIANQYAMARERQESCFWDFELMDRSISSVLRDHMGEGTEVNVVYHDAGGNLRFAADAFRASGVFDAVAQNLRDSFRLPKAVKFNARRCGEANAFYDRDTLEVIFCYELMKELMELNLADLPAPSREGGKVKSQ